MKKTLYIAVCVVGLICASSCRSASKPCGLASIEITEQVAELVS